MSGTHATDPERPMTRLRAALALLLLFTGTASAADWEGSYEGTLGKAQIIVQLVEPLDDMEGETKRETSRYSYVPKARDLNLFLTGQDGALGFEETPQQPWEYNAPENKKIITGRWNLTFRAGKATGTWVSPDGKRKLPIQLTLVPDLTREEVDPDLNTQNETYNSLWLKSVTFAAAGQAKRFGAVEVAMVKDSAFGIAFPVLTSHPDAAQMERVNAMLLKQHRATVSGYRDCKNGVPLEWEGENGEPEMAYEIDYASASVLSISESGSVFCGGAHPNNYITPKTFDLTSLVQMGGQYNLDLSPDGFGRVLKLANREERVAFERHALGLWQAAEAKDATMDGVCKTGFIEDAPEGEKMFSLSFAPGGLAVRRTDYPHVASVCLSTDFNPTVIPWADLKPWLKPGQTLLTTEVAP